MKKEYIDYLEDIVNAMAKSESFIKDDKTCFAVIRALEIIGEATKNIPESIRTKYPDIPWRDMAGMRDKLIHEYSGVRFDLVWKTIKEIIPSLKLKFQRIIDELDS